MHTSGCLAIGLRAIRQAARPVAYGRANFAMMYASAMNIMMKRCLGFLALATILVLGCNSRLPQKNGIIALTPSLAEVVWALDANNEHPLIGVSPFTNDSRAENIAKIQNVGALETIISMHPEFVLLHPSDDLLAEKLEKMGVPVLLHSMDTVSEVDEAVRDIGKHLNQAENAERVLSSMHRELENNKSHYKRENPPKTLLIIDRLDMRFQQLYLADSDSYLSELSSGCGLSPVTTSNQKWTRIEAEKLIAMNPQNILFFARSPEDAVVVRREFEKQYPMLDAVRANKVFVYNEPDITVPGPDMPKRQKKLCEAVLKAF